MKILVTGAAGSVGRALCPRLRTLNHEVIETDVVPQFLQMDVTDPHAVAAKMEKHSPHLTIHLAGFKQAPRGEAEPAEVARINITGTKNMVDTGVRVILASTCKAADPETVYGASKLIAERMVLNAGGTVARFYNVPDTDGNVFRYWESIPENEPIPFTPCNRYFITMDEVLDLLTRCLYLSSGRYTIAKPDLRRMEAMARILYPRRKLVQTPRRRGDRYAEPKMASCERIEQIQDGIIRIFNPHDA